MAKVTKKAAKSATKKVSTKSKSRAKSSFTDLGGTIRKGLNAAMIGAFALLVLGILLVIFPITFLDILRWIIATLCFVGGATIFASRMRGYTFIGTTVVAAILIAVGLLFAFNEKVTGIFSVVLGIWFVITSLASSTISSALTGPTAFFSRLMAFISLVCGILMIINPFGGSVSIMVFLGAVTIVHAVSSLIDVAIMKSHLDDLGRKINSVIVEGEEVK